MMASLWRGVALKCDFGSFGNWIYLMLGKLATPVMFLDGRHRSAGSLESEWLHFIFYRAC